MQRNEDPPQPLSLQGAADLIGERIGAPENIPAAPEPQPEPQEPEAPAEEGAEPAGREPESQQPEHDESAAHTLQDLAERLGSTVDDLLSLSHTVGDGENQRDVTISEAIQNLNNQRDYEAETTKVRELYARVEANDAQIFEQWRQQHQQMAAIGQMQLQRLTAAQNSAQMEQLKVTDPGRWAAQMHTLQQAQQRVGAELSRFADQYQVQERQLMMNRLQREQQLMQHLSPTWGEADVRKVQALASERGFSQEEMIALNGSARLSLAMAELADFRKQQAALKKAKKEGKAKLDEARKSQPQAAKPGKPSSRRNRSARNRQAAEQRLRKSGKLKDAASLLASKLGDGFLGHR